MFGINSYSMQPCRKSEWLRVFAVFDLSCRSMPRLSPTVPSRVSSAMAKALTNNSRSRRVGSPIGWAAPLIWLSVWKKEIATRRNDGRRTQVTTRAAGELRRVANGVRLGGQALIATVIASARVEEAGRSDTPIPD